MSLNILLTNDDSFDAPGITSLFETLVDAGHNVQIVAPMDEQSAQGSTLGGIEAVTGSYTIEEFAPGNFFVDATTVASVLTGLELAELGVIFPDEEIDVVLSGTNSGENIGPSPNISGTVNGAVAALFEGLPAIAVSADADELGDPGFEAAGDFVIDLLAMLDAQQPEGAPLLPEGIGLNVNVPATLDPTGVAMTVIDEEASAFFPISQIADEPPTFESDFFPAETSTGNAISEGAQFILDFITVSAIDGNWFSSEADRLTLEQRLDGVLDAEQDSDVALDILLTNDDGFGAEGIEAVREALLAAGHTVTVIAPAENESFEGSALTLETWTAEEFGDGDFSVEALPNTTLDTALEAILADDLPDLVIAGANEGASTGVTANTSPVLAQAVNAIFEFDIPAIALSTGTGPLNEVPDGLFEFSGSFVAELVDSLLETAPESGDLLPAGRGLNVNIPVDASLEEVAFTRLDEATAQDIGVELIPVPGNTDTFRFAFEGPVVTDDPASEGTSFLAGNITISPLDGNYTAGLPETLAVADLLGLTFGLPTVFDGEDPVAEDPADEAPVDEDPVAEDPADEAPVDEDPVAEDPADEAPVDEDPVAEDPADEAPVDEDPVAEDPADEAPVDGDPVAEDPADEAPVPEDPLVEDEPLIGEMVGDEPAAEEPVMEIEGPGAEPLPEPAIPIDPATPIGELLLDSESTLIA